MRPGDPISAKRLVVWEPGLIAMHHRSSQPALDFTPPDPDLSDPRFSGMVRAPPVRLVDRPRVRVSLFASSSRGLVGRGGGSWPDRDGTPCSSVVMSSSRSSPSAPSTPALRSVSTGAGRRSAADEDAQPSPRRCAIA